MTNPFPKKLTGYRDSWGTPAAPVWHKFPIPRVGPAPPAFPMAVRPAPQLSPQQRSTWPAPFPIKQRSVGGVIPPKPFQPARAVPSKVNATPTRAAVQRYVELMDGTIWSDNDLYSLPGRGGDHIWAFKGAAPPRASAATGKTSIVNKKQYKEYKSNFMLQDCLHTAEEIMANGALAYSGGVYSQTADAAHSPFGETTKKNRNLAIARAGLLTSDAAASPNVGEAFVIVRKNPAAVGASPYHAAGVVAVDGADRFTLEQSASGTDAHKRRLALGMYDVYSVGDVNGQSFHTRHSVDYNDGVTFVLQNNGTVPFKTFAQRDAWRATHKKTKAMFFK